MTDLPFVVFSCECQSNCTVLGCDDNGWQEDDGAHLTLVESVSASLIRSTDINFVGFPQCIAMAMPSSPYLMACILLSPPHSFNSTYGCTILLGVVLPVKTEWAEGNISSNRLWQQHFQKAKLEKNLSGKLSRNNAVKPPLASCFFLGVVFLLSLHCICSHFYFHQSRRNGFTILYTLLAGQIDTSEVKLTWFYIFFSCYYVLTHFNKSEHTSVLIHLTNSAYKLCWICSILKLHCCLFMMHFSHLQQRRHCNDFCWQPRQNRILDHYLLTVDNVNMQLACSE